MIKSEQRHELALEFLRNCQTIPNIAEVEGFVNKVYELGWWDGYDRGYDSGWTNGPCA